MPLSQNRIVAYLSRPLGYDPPEYRVIDGRRVLLETRNWPEAKGCRDQWRELGFPTPRVMVVRRS